MSRKIDFSSLEVSNIHMWDYPDFCDAYISSGCYLDGTELSEQDLEQLNNNRDLVYSLVEKVIYQENNYGKTSNEFRDKRSYQCN